VLGEVQGTHERSATAIVSGHLFRTIATETEDRPSYYLDPLADFRFHFLKKIQFLILRNVNGIGAFRHLQVENLIRVDFTEKVKFVSLSAHKGFTRAIER
jgi:hypothetical protein